MANSLVLGVDARRGPLDGRVLLDSAAFSIRPAPAAARFILRGTREMAARVDAALGAPLPFQPNRAATVGTRVAIWLGPDEWLLVAPGEDAGALAATLEKALADQSHSLVDVSERQIGIEVAGALAARALSAGCPLDFNEVSFPQGMGTRTILAKCEIVLWRRESARFHLEVWRSFADYAADFLIEAARCAPVGRNP
jgi:sarcosine oxidase subunit gamma